MVTDEEIAELFGKVVRDLDPRVDAMVRQAERLGRRRRARRRAWIAAGNAAALAVVAGVSLLVGTHQAPLTPARAAAGAATRHRGAGHRPSPRVGRAGSPSPSVSVPAVRKTGSASPSPGGSAGMTPRQMLTTLRRLLPGRSCRTSLPSPAAVTWRSTTTTVRARWIS